MTTLTDTAPDRRDSAIGVQRQLAELDAQGYTVIPDFLRANDLQRVRAGLAPHLGSHTGRNSFEGVRTEGDDTQVGRGR